MVIIFIFCMQGEEKEVDCFVFIERIAGLFKNLYNMPLYNTLHIYANNFLLINICLTVIGKIITKLDVKNASFDLSFCD